MIEEQLRIKQIEFETKSDDSSERVIAAVGSKKIKQSEDFVYGFEMGANLLNVKMAQKDQHHEIWKPKAI